MKRIHFIYLFAMALATLGCSSNKNNEEAYSDTENFAVRHMPQGFEAYKGVNIAHWLSQVFGWSPRATFFTKDDVALIDSLGFDHIRMPIDEEQLWTPDGKRIPEAFDYLKKSIEWCKEYNLRIIVDMHIIRSHHFNAGNGEGAMTLWADTVAQNTFIALWADLQDFLHEYPNDLLAYELMNEPVAPEPEGWNKLIARILSHIRKTEPNRVVFVGSNNWQTLQNIPFLKIPDGDTNIVIAFHNYDPLLVTHHLAQWTGFKAYSGPVQYPGLSATPQDLWSQLDSTNSSLVGEINRINGVFNADVFDTMISIAVKRGRELNLSVYCGEFGCLANVDTATRLQYYRDFVGVLNKYRIGRAHWDYKGSFQIVGYDVKTMQNTNILDTAVIRILTR